MTQSHKIVITFLCAITLFLSFIQPIHADIGPKPSITITIEGIEQKTYYATLLSQRKSTGPASVYDGTNARYTQEDAFYDIWNIFLDYQDTDGFYFLQEIWDCSDTNHFRWGYYPPETFKILLYFPDTQQFIVSDIYERYAFDSYYTIQISDTSLSVCNDVIKSYDYSLEIQSLLVRIVLTIALELIIALLMKISSKKDITYIAIINLITQVGLNLALNAINFYKGQYAFVFYYILLELAIIVIESICYKKKLSTQKALSYSLVANICSFGFGLWLAQILPGIF